MIRSSPGLGEVNSCRSRATTSPTQSVKTPMASGVGTGQGSSVPEGSTRHIVSDGIPPRVEALRPGHIGPEAEPGSHPGGRRKARRGPMPCGIGFRTVRRMEPAIEVRDLRMAYDATEVVHGIDLTVGPGEVFAVLGPNGAGKTTTIEILEGFRRRTDGLVRVLGVDPQRAGASWRERVGVVLQSSSPEAELTRGRDASSLRRVLRQPGADRSTSSSCADWRIRLPCATSGSPAANSAGSMWRWRSSGIPSFCSSTSRPPASTRRRGDRPGA